jgi:hypothetical protein
MPVERRQRLEALGFEWSLLTDGWGEGFAALERFKAREGHVRVPHRHLEGTYALGRWAGRQRSQMGILPLERRQRLETMGFECDLLDAAWEEGIAALERFKASNGHCRVPQGYLEGTYRLGQWVSNQRSQKDTMPVERRQRLESLGFDWDPLTTCWEEGYSALERFKAREGHCRIRIKHIEGTYRLGQWVSVQRERRNIMSVERRQRLDALGFVWRATLKKLPDPKLKSAEFQSLSGM